MNKLVIASLTTLYVITNISLAYAAPKACVFEYTIFCEAASLSCTKLAANHHFAATYAINSKTNRFVVCYPNGKSGVCLNIDQYKEDFSDGYLIRTFVDGSTVFSLSVYVGRLHSNWGNADSDAAFTKAAMLRFHSASVDIGSPNAEKTMLSIGQCRLNQTP